MKITEIRTSYKITMENEMCGMEMYLDTGCKVRITFDERGKLSQVAFMCRIWGYSPKNDMIIIEVDDAGLRCNSSQNNGYRNRIGKKERSAESQKRLTAPRVCMGAAMVLLRSRTLF